MKTSVLILIAALTLCGCATSTIQTRKQERSAAYAELPAETAALRAWITASSVPASWAA